MDQHCDNGHCSHQDHGAGNFVPLKELTGRTIYRARLLCSNETEYCVPDEESIKLADNDMVILPTRYGKDMVRIAGASTDRSSLENEKVRQIVRLATKDDLDRKKQNKAREDKALETCRDKVHRHNLDMKLVAAHYLVDEPKIIFFFTAENRIDFRELVKDLVGIFRLRIELRQIGVRDEARVLGGLAVCGRDYCCHGMTDKLVPVSIKMAKDQSLSLNSLKISGPCGRLLCCLSYEHQYYQEVRDQFPPEGWRFRIEEIDYKVHDINVFSRKVTLMSQEGRQLTISLDSFYRDETGKDWKIQKGTDVSSYGEETLLSK
jgi:cell fate regulator YaaT (PSP1 superfamily)